MDTKTCIACGETKPLTDFHRHSRGKHHPRCKDCRSILDRVERREKNAVLREREELGKQGKRRCGTCREVKSLDDFTRASDKKNGRRNSCRACCSAAAAAYNARPEVAAARAAKRRARIEADRELHTRRQRSNALKSKYGLTLDDYERMLEDQGWTCAICDTTEEQNGQALCVDHDHACCQGEKSCGKCIRGLLCRRHNRALGYFGDSDAELAAGISYLQAARGRLRPAS